MKKLHDGTPVEWRILHGLTDYEPALAEMTLQARKIADGLANEQIWLLEHPPVYTAGTSAKAEDLLNPGLFPVFHTGRGGQYTYHGPGQRVVYVMLDLRQRQKNVRAFVQALEAWIIDTLSHFCILGEIREGRVGVWVRRPEFGPDREDKIAAIGVRLSRWVSFHGLSININPDLRNYSGIVPCGISNQGVTSFSDLGVDVQEEEIDNVLRVKFENHFGPSILHDRNETVL